MEFENDKM